MRGGRYARRSQRPHRRAIRAQSFLMDFLFGPLMTYIRAPSRLASTWPDVLLLAPAGPAVPIDKLNDWIRKNDPVVMDIRPTSEMDLNSYGQLVKLLKFMNCVSRQYKYIVEPSSNLLDSMPLRVGRSQERATR